MEATSKPIAVIAIIIWLIALAVNTGLGVYVVFDHVKMKISELAVKGLVYGGIFSFPIFLVLWALLYIMHRGMFTAGNIFLILIFAAGLMTLGSFYLFSGYMHLSATLNIPLGGCALAASALAILSQFNSMRKVCFHRDHPGHFKKRDNPDP